MIKYITINGYDDVRKFFSSENMKSTYPIPNKPKYIKVLTSIMHSLQQDSDMLFDSPPPRVILCCLNEYEKLIGKYYAYVRFTSPTVIDSFEKLLDYLCLNNFTSYLIFMPSKLFSLHNMAKIHAVISNKVEIPSLGFYPCGNPELLMFNVVKDICYESVKFEEKLSLMRTVKKDFPNYSSEKKVTIYNQDSASYV